MRQNAFGGLALPGPAGGAYSAPPDPIAELRGREGSGKGGGEGEEGKGREGEQERIEDLSPMFEVR